VSNSLAIEDGAGEIIDSLDSDYIYMEIFRAFDIEGKGIIERADLEVASSAMGWNTEQGKSIFDIHHFQSLI
jgi:hypothetical protein